MTKEEKSAYNRAYLAANRDKIQARKAAYRAANRLRLCAETKAYTAANYEHYITLRRIRQAANRAKLNAERREFYWKDPEKGRDVKRRYRERNPGYDKEARERYRSTAEGQAKDKAYGKAYYAKHRARVVENIKQWALDNPVRFKALRLATSRAYYLRLTRSMPAWADQAAIRLVYDESARLTAETGIAHHVDHIVPLSGKNVCGLHVASNLRIVHASVNQRKRNDFYEELLTSHSQGTSYPTPPIKVA